MLLRDRLAENPADADALTMLAGIAVEQERMGDATLLLRQAVAADPSPVRRLALIQHLHDCANPEMVLTEIEALPAAARAEFEIRSIESAALGQIGLHDRQIEVYRAMA